MAAYLSSKISIKRSHNGLGLFSNKKIKKGEIVIDYSNAPGKFLSLKEADKLYGGGNDYMIQIDNDLFFVATTSSELEDADFVNHSCEPNCGIKGSLKFVAMRDINKGEEITIDYAMSESSDYQMICNCQNKNCRKIISGHDWKNKKLQQKYKGYFSDYLQKLFL